MTATIPTNHTDPINAQILAVSEDRLQGFHSEPFQEIARLSGVDLSVVLERVRAMLEAGVIRRVRQTLNSTKLAHGALVAWKVDPARLDETFDFMFREDPFSGHVVTRSTDREVSGSDYKLWTTLKVPLGESLELTVQHLIAEFFFRLEVVIEVALATQLRAFDDVVDRGRGEPSLGDQRRGCVQDLSSAV